jgi:hypothetical protein
MKFARRDSVQAATLFELSIALGLIGSVGLAIYSMLNVGMILGAKNTAVNTAHQQARVAMLQLVQDLHSCVSLPALCDVDSVPLVNPAPNTPAPGISFQLWAGGPYQIVADAAIGAITIQIQLTGTDVVPQVGERLIIDTHGIENDITAVSGVGGNKYNITLASPIGAAISGTGSPTFYNISCFITDRCSYVVKNGALEWRGPTAKKAFAVLGNDITSATPFSIPSTPAGALYYRFVAAIDLSTADGKYSNRGFKSANILLNGQVPMRARLTTYQ